MQLEDYFELQPDPNCDRIAVKGTRFGIENILEPYLQGETPERIVRDHRRAVTPEQVYATITYYHNRQNEIDELPLQGTSI